MSARRLTVLQVLPALESGGVERGTLEVAKALVDKGHRSLVMSAGGRLVEQLIGEGSEHFTWEIGKKSFKPFFLIRKLRRFFKEQQIDIVHVRSRLPAWIVYLAWKGMNEDVRPKFVTTVHGFNSVSWYSEIMTRSEKVIAVSNSVKQYVLDNYPRLDDSKITVIHRGVDPSHYPFAYKPDEAWLDQWFRQFPMLVGKMIITLPGRITRLKGHEDFIQIISALVSRNFPVIGLIAGGVEEKKQEYFAELERSIEAGQLTDHLLFTGYRSDLREILAVSNFVLTLTTKPESFGRTTLEALSMGVPVCGYAHGGVKEQMDVLLPEGEVEVHDVQGVVDTLAAWLDNPPVVRQGHDFLLENMLNKTVDLYERLAHVS